MPVFRSLIALLTLIALSSCSVSEPDNGVIEVDHTYGTLKFGGIVERIDHGGEYEFRTAIDATFLPHGEVNRVAAARLRRYFLSATEETDPGEPSEPLYRDEEAIDVVLSEDGETTRLPGLSFSIPKSVAGQAAHLSLAVSDGVIMWPIVEDLR